MMSNRNVAFVVFTLTMAASGCVSPGKTAADAAERYGRQCESLGYAAGSERFRSCVETQEMNEALATQREYDKKLLRRMDCVDPRFACDGPSR